MKKDVKKTVEVKDKPLGGTQVKEKEVVEEHGLLGKNVKVTETKKKIKD
jgi:hypothetical protein